MSATVADIMAKVDAEKAGVDSAVALIQGLSQKIKDLIAAAAAAGTTVDPAALQAIADELDANTTELATAVTANPVPTP